MQNNHPISLGIINFVNCMPINYSLDKWHIEKIKISRGYPVLINQLLSENQLHAAPISSIEYIKNKDRYSLIESACISSDNEVGSVILFSNYKIEDLNNKKIGLPYTSATSITVLKILLHSYGVNLKKCEFIAHKYGSPLKLALQNEFDAVLYIGNPALIANTNFNESDGFYKYDMGVEWKKLTGYPMVFGTWVARSDWKNNYEDDFEWLCILLNKAVDSGLHVYFNEIVDKSAKILNLSKSVIEDYLKNKLNYNFSSQHHFSLELFEDKYNKLIEFEGI